VPSLFALNALFAEREALRTPQLFNFYRLHKDLGC
jgi:hypothetical protein